MRETKRGYDDNVVKTKGPSLFTDVNISTICTSTRKKLLLLIISGVALGIAMPKNKNLPNQSVRILSSCTGYTYFLCWSLSFYPQLLLNYSRKSTVGLSTDFAVLNVVGFICYAIYCGFFFWDEAVQQEYQERHQFEDGAFNPRNIVQSNDVAFALHAFLLSVFYYGQIMYYNTIETIDERGNPPHHLSPWTAILLLGITILCVRDAVLVSFAINGHQFIDYLYMLSSIKLIITIVKYMPQVLLNFSRKSTAGWNVWNVLLDFAGGILSLLQLLLDALAMNDFSAITGNWVKFGLSLVSIFFDVIFMTQHYVLYPDQISSLEQEEYESLSLARDSSFEDNT